MKTLEDYLEYKKRELDTCYDIETWESLINEIASIFEQISARRNVKKYYTKKWLNIEKGERLDWNTLATWIAEIQSWEYNPEIFERDEKRFESIQYVGTFDLTLVVDWSGSMYWIQNREQKRATLLILEAMKLLQERMEDSIIDTQLKIDFNTQVVMFWHRPIEVLKKISTHFSDEERINVFKYLDSTDGWTNDYEALEYIYNL
jgi:hypothetical protein